MTDKKFANLISNFKITVAQNYDKEYFEIEDNGVVTYKAIPCLVDYIGKKPKKKEYSQILYNEIKDSIKKLSYKIKASSNSSMIIGNAPHIALLLGMQRSLGVQLGYKEYLKEE